MDTELKVPEAVREQLRDQPIEQKLFDATIDPETDTVKIALPVEEEPAGHVGPEPEKLIRDAFLRFHRENPHVYVELVKLSRQLKEVGHKRIGIGMLFEVLRWKQALVTVGDGFKLNNNYRSYYARMMMNAEPDLRGIFELRKLHGPE